MPKITEMFAFVVADKNPEDEGIMGFRSMTGEWLPLVGADIARVEALKPIADKVCKQIGKPYKILHFLLAGEKGA